MPPLIDLTGQVFGRLTATKRLPNRNAKVIWECVCECGSVTRAVSGDLLFGHTRSCGCLQNDVRGKNQEGTSKKHGHTRYGRASPTYKSWNAMHSRCNPNTAVKRARKEYVERGITICNRWESFENFLADMGERPKGKTLDRYPNPNGNYEPSNCRWATVAEQNRNRRS